MQVLRKIIEIDEELCDGCGQCVPGCAEGALQIIDGKARVINDKYCDGLGACIGECPTGALKIVEREVEEFDEDAVEEHLKKQATSREQADSVLACGCPSEQMQTFPTAAACESANKPAAFGQPESALSHWPVQIRLVPSSAPFLKGADLLVAADCVPVAYAAFHRDLLPGKAVLIGCPKFDDIQDYIARFTAIFKEAEIKSVTVVIMEVPCCSGLPAIVGKGMQAAGVEIPIKELVVSSRGRIIKDSLRE